MLWRFEGSPASGGSLEDFPDGGTVSGYAAEAIRWAVETGIITGMDGGTIQHRGTASRAQLAVILERTSKQVRT